MKPQLNENGTCNPSRRHAVPLAAVRGVPRPANREYLRALRAAELAAWQEPKLHWHFAPASPAPLFPPRLPRPTRDAAEGRVFAVLSVLALASVMHGLMTSSEFVLHWDRFVALVRHWLG
jgi:hypothetical protein